MPDSVTIILVKHDLDVAGQAKRRIRLKDGRVLTDERSEAGAVAA